MKAKTALLLVDLAVQCFHLALGWPVLSFQWT